MVRNIREYRVLLEKLAQIEDIQQAILSILNISDFSLQDVMGKWTLLTNGQRQLARLWIERHPDESYLYHCVHGAGDDQDIEKRVLHEVFSIRSTHPDWVHESQILIKTPGYDYICI